MAFFISFLTFKGNITLAAATGAKLYQMENCSFAEADLRMEKLAKKLAESGKKSYIIPRGGSNHVSIWKRGSF